MSGAGTADAGAAAAATAGTFSADPNYAKLDPELQTAFKSKGWDVRTPFETAVETMKSYREMEKHFGVPADRIARIPKDTNDAEGWKALNAKLGVPDKPEGYDFSAIKFSDGTELDAGFVEKMRAAVLSEGIPPVRAQNLVSQFVKYMESAETDETAARTAALTEQRENWVKSCGPNLKANEFIADQAAQKLGWGPEFFAALKEMNVVGADKVMEGLLKVGKMMGEDKFVSSPNSSTSGVLTREQALERIKELKADQAFVTKLMSGDDKANKEFSALERIVAGA